MGRTKSTVKTSRKKVMVVPVSVAKKKRTRPRTSKLGKIGKMAGSYFGPFGADLGRAAGNMISHITGMGSYKVSDNTIVKGNSVPTFASSQDGMRICHREFLTDLSGSTSFTTQRVIRLNPGLITSFPLLSQICHCFEEYDFRGLVVEYRPSSGSAVSSTSSALGLVVMATCYDAADPLFVNKQEMESYEFSSSVVANEGCIHPVECARNRNVLDRLYVRTGGVPANTDIRFFDHGFTQIATSGMQSQYIVGEIWLAYDIFVRKPRLHLSQNLSNAVVYHLTSSPDATMSNFLGTSPQIDGDDPTIVTSFTSTGPLASRKILILLSRPGRYFVRNTQYFPGGLNAAQSIAKGHNLSWVNSLVSRTQSSIEVDGTLNFSWDIAVDVLTSGTSTDNQVSIPWNPAGTAVDSCASDVWVSKLRELPERRSRLLTPEPRAPPPGMEITDDLRRLSFSDWKMD